MGAEEDPQRRRQGVVEQGELKSDELVARSLFSPAVISASPMRPIANEIPPSSIASHAQSGCDRERMPRKR